MTDKTAHRIGSTALELYGPYRREAIRLQCEQRRLLDEAQTHGLYPYMEERLEEINRRLDELKALNAAETSALLHQADTLVATQRRAA